MNPNEQDKMKQQNRRIWAGVGLGLIVLVTAAAIVSPDPASEPATVAQADEPDQQATLPPAATKEDPATTGPEEPEQAEPEEPETVDPVEATEEPTEVPEPEFDTAAATQELEETITASIGGQQISDFCDGYADTSWFCFFDHYEVVSPSRIDMHMEFYGGLDTRALAEEGRSWTANMLWDNLPELTTIVSFDSTGLDLGTTRR